jgi:hypothetical protein
VLNAILDLNADKKTRAWDYKGQIGGESANEVFALATGTPGPSRRVTVYFTANDSSDRILEHQFIPGTFNPA